MWRRCASMGIELLRKAELGQHAFYLLYAFEAAGEIEPVWDPPIGGTGGTIGGHRGVSVLGIGDGAQGVGHFLVVEETGFVHGFQPLAGFA